jgi:TRAP transporter 4TM/12TM fusion protein
LAGNGGGGPHPGPLGDSAMESPTPEAKSSPETGVVAERGLHGTRSGRQLWTAVFGVCLCLFTLAEVNYPRLSPQGQLAVFALLGLVLCFLNYPLHPRWQKHWVSRYADIALCVLAVVGCGYVLIQTEPIFRNWWIQGQSLGNRAGQESGLDLAVGLLLAGLVIEAARRSLGMALPLLALVFVGYALWGARLPDWLLPHRGYDLQRTVAQTVLQGQGVFGVALRVMFTYVFLFVIFGAFLKATGATQFIIDFARHLFRNSLGGPAKVAVLSSGLMGSLSGSAVANTATTGTFTIPMMRASGYRPETAAGIEAAASSGGALVPPVMGAAAYMMLELVTPPVTYLQIIRAAILPAVLFYLSLFLIVHFHSKRLGTLAADRVTGAGIAGARPAQWNLMAGLVFAFAFVSLIIFLVLGYSAFRAVTLSLGVILLLSFFSRSTRMNVAGMVQALTQSARDVIPLVSAAACVGVVIGVVTLTGVGTRLPGLILPLAQGNLFLALLLIMLSSIILGLGLPSVVCYLLMATLVGPVLGQMGVVPLAAHFFIFYFGMLSMVTPPVALAAYAASSIAGSPMMATAWAAFRFSLVGFTLPFMFVFRPELLMLDASGGSASWLAMAYAFGIAALGITGFAAGLSGQFLQPIGWRMRSLAFLSAGLLLFPGKGTAGMPIPLHDALGIALLAALTLLNWKRAVPGAAA